MADRRTRGTLLVGLALAFSSCHHATTMPPAPNDITVTHAFVTETVDGCALASPLLVTSQGTSFVLTTSDDGVLRAYDPSARGALGWSVALPAPEGYIPNATATPVLFDDSHLVIAYQITHTADDTRIQHLVAVLDLEARMLDPAFGELELTASKPAADGTTVDFLPSNAFSRAALALAHPADRTRGLVYVSFGNIRDIQPWHGWVFEVDLDRWHDAGAPSAISGVLLTTAESSCGTPGMSGSESMICGGGVWSPGGPKVIRDPDGTERLLIPTGNGALDLPRHDYANSILSVPRGLTFDPACDSTTCSTFDPHAPTDACIASCANLFVPRLLPTDPPLAPPSGACAGLSFFDCYAAIDWDLGAGSPLVLDVGSTRAVALPAKDGALYLFDAMHLGTLFDRKQATEPCGAPSDICTADWAGTMITEPTLVPGSSPPLILVPTHMFDHTHGAGVVAMRVMPGVDHPTLEPAWTAPDITSDEARTHFRQAPGRIAIVALGGQSYAVVVDVALSGPGTLYVIRTATGEIAARMPLVGEGQRYVKPLVDGSRIYVTSCGHSEGPGHLEAYDSSAWSSGPTERPTRPGNERWRVSSRSPHQAPTEAPMDSLTRRDALTALAAAAATIATHNLAAAQDHAHGAAPSPSPGTAPPAFAGAHEVVALPFRPTALNGISERMIVSHHDNNYAGAVRNLNRVEQELARVTADTPPFVVSGLHASELMFRNSKTLHEAYFGNLGGDGHRVGTIETALAHAYGASSSWEAHFRAIAAGLGGGSGWVILGLELDTGALRTTAATNHKEVLATSAPLLVLDMYEHAYAIDFGATAARYIDAFFVNVKWDEVNHRFERAGRASAALRG